MPKIIPRTIKLKAMKLYLSGKTAREIAQEVSTSDVAVKPVTIYSWAKKDQWEQQKDVARSDAQQKIAESEGQRFARLQQDQLTNYTSIAAKANRELEGLTFDNAFAAVKAIDVGIKGQRDVLGGLINLQFVQDVLGILVEEVTDQDVLNRIAVKFKTLVQNQEDS